MPFRLFSVSSSAPFAWPIVGCMVALATCLSPPVTADTAPKVKVFFLVGQSNMEGKGNPAHLDTYKDDPTIQPTYAGLKDGDQWAVRDDVWITYPSKHGGEKHGPLTVGYGTKGEQSIGPEFGFGHTVGNAIDAPVLLIKIAWGGKSLAVDFRPPGSPPSETERMERLEQERKRNPQAQLSDVQEKYGHYYRETVRLANQELAQMAERFPHLADHEPEICGFVWHQGFNDIINGKLRENDYVDYTRWLEQFILDMRKDLNTPEMPFIIGELSTGGIPNRGAFQVAQANVAKSDALKDSVRFVPTAEFYDTYAQELFEKGLWKGTDEEKALWNTVGNDRPYHYLGSGKTYYLKGVAFGEAALEAMQASSAN